MSIEPNAIQRVAIEVLAHTFGSVRVENGADDALVITCGRWADEDTYIPVVIVTVDADGTVTNDIAEPTVSFGYTQS